MVDLFLTLENSYDNSNEAASKFLSHFQYLRDELAEDRYNCGWKRMLTGMRKELRKFKGRLVVESCGFGDDEQITGIEFKTEGDLIFFVLKWA